MPKRQLLRSTDIFIWRQVFCPIWDVLVSPTWSSQLVQKGVCHSCALCTVWHPRRITQGTPGPSGHSLDEDIQIKFTFPLFAGFAPCNNLYHCCYNRKASSAFSALRSHQLLCLCLFLSPVYPTALGWCFAGPPKHNNGWHLTDQVHDTEGTMGQVDGLEHRGWKHCQSRRQCFPQPGDSHSELGLAWLLLSAILAAFRAANKPKQVSTHRK